MKSEIEQLKESYAKVKETALQDFYTFLKFQSISSEPAFKPQINACVEWLSGFLKKMGFNVEILPTEGHPTIFATYEKAGADQPTLLIYNHYDVQPVDPLDLWQSPPFEPTVRNGQVYARGAQDNKGQCFYVLLALKTLIERDGALPINIKLCIEGEEECGSAGLSGLLKHKKKNLEADYLAIVDLGIPNITTPAITLGLRGLVALDIEVTGTDTDLHSGSHGGLAFNPIHALVQLLSKVRDDSGKITIPGFYDDVMPISEEEKPKLSFDFDANNYEKSFGAKPTGGERNLHPLERKWLRPTLEINGIYGGYTGDGVKTVIPAKASAKITCRLVPNQEPEKIGKLVADFLEANAPEGTKATAHVHKGGGPSVRANINSPAVQAYAKAYQEVFGKPCQFIFSGASIPITAELAAASGSEIVLVGMGLPDDCIHAPNEHFGIDRIEMGFLATARVLQLLKK